MNTKFGSYYISPLSLRYMYKYFKLLRWRYNRGNRGIQGFRRHLESIVFTIAPPANLPVGNSIVFAPLALLCFVMASETLNPPIYSNFHIYGYLCYVIFIY
jgi:hypothetical protein